MNLTRSIGLLFFVSLLQAHVGSPDVYLDAQAGPYKLFITLRPPTVIPGVAQLEVRSESSGVQAIEAAPLPLTKAGEQLAPVSDKLKVSAQDPQFFSGSLWMMASGSWQVRVKVSGTRGVGVVAVPVPAVALSTKPMKADLAVPLFILMLLLVAGFVLMVGASVREAKLPAGTKPTDENKQRARAAMAIAFALILGVLWVGRSWWKKSEEDYRTKVYKPLQMAASVNPSGTMTLRLTNPAWMNQPFRNGSSNGPALFTRVIDDLVPDHDHLMHLYAIREPGLDVVYHLHPELRQTGLFQLELPSMESGKYRLYADIVHENGFAETMVSQTAIPDGLPRRSLRGDDAEGTAAAWEPGHEVTRFTLPDGYVMEWLRPSGVLRAKAGIPFRFRLLSAKGRPASDMQFYMGMLGHAAFVKTDGSTFAHVHPTGSVSMSSFMLAESQAGPAAQAMASMEMPGMDRDMKMSETLPSEVVFPYGFPASGQYRIFVQMKHGGAIETGIFDALVAQ